MHASRRALPPPPLIEAANRICGFIKYRWQVLAEPMHSKMHLKPRKWSSRIPNQQSVRKQKFVTVRLGRKTETELACIAKCHSPAIESSSNELAARMRLQA